MEATPPDEPIQKKPPARVSASKAAQAPQRDEVVEHEFPSAGVMVDNERETIRIMGAFSLGMMVFLVICVLAFLIAYRNIPEGL